MQLSRFVFGLLFNGNNFFLKDFFLGCDGRYDKLLLGRVSVFATTAALAFRGGCLLLLLDGSLFLFGGNFNGSGGVDVQGLLRLLFFDLSSVGIDGEDLVLGLGYYRFFYRNSGRLSLGSLLGRTLGLDRSDDLLGLFFGLRGFIERLSNLGLSDGLLGFPWLVACVKLLLLGEAGHGFSSSLVAHDDGSESELLRRHSVLNCISLPVELHRLVLGFLLVKLFAFVAGVSGAFLIRALLFQDLGLEGQLFVLVLLIGLLSTGRLLLFLNFLCALKQVVRVGKSLGDLLIFQDLLRLLVDSGTERVLGLNCFSLLGLLVVELVLGLHNEVGSVCCQLVETTVDSCDVLGSHTVSVLTRHEAE